MKTTKTRTRAALALAALFLAAAAPALAQQTFNTTIYLDWTQFVTKDGLRTSDQKSSFFAFRRAYFTYENKVNDNLKFRFRFDADNTANLTSVSVNFPAESVSTKKDDKLRPYIKHLYLEYSNLLPNSSIKVGMADTLTFKPAEDRWGYRSVAKTLMDGYKDITGVEVDATSADIGASLTGSLTKYFRYGFMVTNGAHYSHAENDKYKKFMFQGQVVPLPGLSFVGYLDYEKQDASNSAVTFKLDGFIEMIDNLTLGGEWFVYRNDKNLAGDSRFDSSGFSVFGRYTFEPDKLALFARFDRYEPNDLVADNEVNLVIAGVDWAPFHKSWRLQPNVWYYDYADPAKKRDLVFNLTFFLSF